MLLHEIQLQIPYTLLIKLCLHGHGREIIPEKLYWHNLVADGNIGRQEFV